MYILNRNPHFPCQPRCQDQMRCLHDTAACARNEHTHPARAMYNLELQSGHVGPNQKIPRLLRLAIPLPEIILGNYDVTVLLTAMTSFKQPKYITKG